MVLCLLDNSNSWIICSVHDRRLQLRPQLYTPNVLELFISSQVDCISWCLEFDCVTVLVVKIMEELFEAVWKYSSGYSFVAPSVLHVAFPPLQ